MSKMDSPLLTSGNRNRKLNKKIKKDSCIEFKMGKENIMTGKSDPVGGLASSNNKTSFVNSPFQKIKPSKFKQT